jgi:hypothetical protein
MGCFATDPLGTLTGGAITTSGEDGLLESEKPKPIVPKSTYRMQYPFAPNPNIQSYFDKPQRESIAARHFRPYTSPLATQTAGIQRGPVLPPGGDVTTQLSQEELLRQLQQYNTR